MAKRQKLTQRQKRQVAKKQQQKLAQAQQINEDDLSPALEGLISSRFGEQADIISLKDRNVYRCYLRQNLGAPVPGDKVLFKTAKSGPGVVEVILPRDSALTRPAQHQGVKPVVANVDCVFIVTAPLPDFSSVLLDRYLVAVENANLQAVIVANKWDLQEEIKQQNIDAQLKIYQNLGYPVLRLSSHSPDQLAALEKAAQNKHSILVGQSGVGKSSLINGLFPNQESLVNKVSENSRLGQHTTTASRLFLFENHNGFIVDSPGIREFGLWHMEQGQIFAGFKEFEPYWGICKFRDCQHLNEPGCAIIRAVENKEISKQRWENYCKIVRTLEE